jgi:hypothetical protein
MKYILIWHTLIRYYIDTMNLVKFNFHGNLFELYYGKKEVLKYMDWECINGIVSFILQFSFITYIFTKIYEYIINSNHS